MLHPIRVCSAAAAIPILSLALACAKLNVGFALSAPREYQVNGDFWSQVKAVHPHFEPRFSENPGEVLHDACCVYTDVWASMGQEAERNKRRQDFWPTRGMRLSWPTRPATLVLCTVCLPDAARK